MSTNNCSCSSGLSKFDKDIYDAIVSESNRQEEHIELIASENYVSKNVLEAQGSVLTNKYAEGYPGKRYYGGCEYVDIAENLAIERAKILFGAHYVNVQPHSGSQANTEAYMALMQHGDTILGMGLEYGGHLTHGSSVSFSGKIYRPVSYGLDSKTEEIDFNQVEDLAKKNKPNVIVCGCSAYSRIIDWKKFRTIADMVGAYMVADIAHIAGLIVAGLHPSPINIADITTSTTHKTLRGPRGGLIMTGNNPEIEKRIQSSVFPGNQGGPLMHIIAAKAVAFKEAMSDDFKKYQENVLKNSKAMANVFINNGFKLVSGGTDNHLFLVNLVNKNVTGKEAENLLHSANITVNKNSIPNDPASPFVTSGIRVGTPAITTRGFNDTNCCKVAQWMCDILNDPTNELKIQSIKREVIDICSLYPVYRNQ